MPSPKRIDSPANDRVKALVRLRGKRERDAQARFIIEEPLVIRRALAAKHPLSEVWACPELFAADTAALYRQIADTEVPVVEASPAVMHKIAYRTRSDGLLLVARQRRWSLSDVRLPSDHAALYVVLESVEKPGNLGAVQRIADGAGADAVFVCDGGVDLDNPNGLRASRGACFALPTLSVATEALLTWLRDHDVRVLAASPGGGEDWYRCDLTGPVALVLGAEHAGLSPELVAVADAAVGIPMQGVGDSLNVATAGAVLLYEAVRQRLASRKAGQG